MCCCAFGCGDLPGNVSDSPTHSCCSESKNSSENSDENESGSCTCLLEKEKAGHKKVTFSPEIKTSDLEPVVPNEVRVQALPKLPLAVQCVRKWPPGHLPIPHTSERLAFIGSYLL